MGLQREQVEITVLGRPRKGLLGFGSKLAIIEAVEKKQESY